MGTDGQPTCGKGLAANADLPAKLGELLGAQAEVLARHTKALDPADPSARPELDAYAKLANSQREVARSLKSLADQMTGYRDLPMTHHDVAVMADPRGQMEAFRRLVGIERELVELLQSKLGEAEAMLR
jgi:hypothetical protein